MKKINVSVLKKLYYPPKKSRKGDNGILLIIGGSKKYHGASWYSIEIASRICDLIYYYSVLENVKLMNRIKAKTPGFITISKKEINKTMENADCVLIGPGLGLGKEIKRLVNQHIKKFPKKKFVLDADALKLVNKKYLNKNCLVTPHANEFKTLFKVKASPDNVKKMANKYQTNIVLKGIKDVICSSDECFYNTFGNQGLTKGGTGDVLAGLISALACKNNLFLAAKAGVLINGKAADSLYKKVGFYYNAWDLILEIPKIFKKYGN